MIKYFRRLTARISSTALICIAILPTSSWGQESLPGILYFDPEWCPRPEELAELSKYMNIRRNGCCIRQALVFGAYRSSPEIIARWRYRISAESAFDAQCTGSILTEEEQQAYDSEHKVKVAAAVAAADEEQRQNVLRHRREAPARLRAMPTNVFCETFGQIVRRDAREEFIDIPNLVALAKTEASHRRLQFNLNIITKRLIRIGISECELYASWGLPSDQNRSVGKWGTHIQHIYGGTREYVYTENGRVTSWQN